MLSLAGEVIRFGPNRISVNNPEGLRVIYGVQANTQKSRFYSVFDHFFDAPSTETTIDKDEHARKRRVLSQSLSDKALKDKEGAILDNFQRFREQLAVPADLERARGTKYALGEWSPPQDMAQLFSFLTFDIMGNICFGKSLETLLSAENRDLIGLIPDGVQALNALGHMPGILKLRVENLLFPRLIGGLHKYKDCSDMLAKACLEKAPQLLVGPRNVLQSLIDQSVSAKASKTRKFSMRELISETSLLIIAGKRSALARLIKVLNGSFRIRYHIQCLSEHHVPSAQQPCHFSHSGFGDRHHLQESGRNCHRREARRMLVLTCLHR